MPPLRIAETPNDLRTWLSGADEMVGALPIRETEVWVPSSVLLLGGSPGEQAHITEVVYRKEAMKKEAYKRENRP